MNRRHLMQSRARGQLLGLARSMDSMGAARARAADSSDLLPFLHSAAHVLRGVAEVLRPPPRHIVYPGPGVRDDAGAEERAADDVRWLRRRTWATARWMLLTACLLAGAVALAWLCPPVAFVGTAGTAAWLAWGVARSKWRELQFVRGEVDSGIRPALRRGPLEAVELDVGGPGEFVAERWDERAWRGPGWVLHWCCTRCGWDTIVSAERDGELQAVAFADVHAVRQRALELAQGVPDQQDVAIAWLEARAAAEEASSKRPGIDAGEAENFRRRALALQDAADAYPALPTNATAIDPWAGIDGAIHSVKTSDLDLHCSSRGVDCDHAD